MRVVPRSLAGQMILAVLAVLVIGELVAFFAFQFERHHAVRVAAVDRFVAQSAAVVQLLAETPPSLHQRIVQGASGPVLRFSLAAKPMLVHTSEDDWTSLLRQHLRARLGNEVREVRVNITEFVRPPRRDRGPDDRRNGDPGDRREHHEGPHFRGLAISLGLNDGRWLNIQTRLPPHAPAWARASTIAILVTAFLSVIAVVLLVRRVTRPLARLGDAAERFGRGETVPPLAEEGPEDVRRTTAAFNRMRERLERFVADRTRMLAAISHDLRTPITSLRLRAELVEDEEVRDKLLATLKDMQEMTEATLAFAREDADAEPTREVDLTALLDSLASDLSEIGPACEIAAAPERLPYRCRPAALKRAFRNLLANAQAYGGGGRIRVAGSATSGVEIDIDDDGPGIPKADLERVFEPFVRVEESRSRETGGIGLGLAIARTILHAHGGEIALTNRPGGGLRQHVTLPPAPKPTAAG